jgi:hypothetical protein
MIVRLLIANWQWQGQRQEAPGLCLFPTLSLTQAAIKSSFTPSHKPGASKAEKFLKQNQNKPVVVMTHESDVKANAKRKVPTKRKIPSQHTKNYSLIIECV